MATLSTAARNAAVDAVTALLGTVIRVFVGSPLSSIVNFSAGGTWGAASNGEAILSNPDLALVVDFLNESPDDLISISLIDVPGQFSVISFSIGTIASGADFELPSTLASVGCVFRIRDWAISMPES